MKKSIFLFIIFNLTLSAQSFDHNVLLELFTNSHCPICPSAYVTVDAYLSNSQDVSRVKYIYYHMSFPYPDDLLYQVNTSDANARNNYYGPFSSTPRGIFDGETQSNNYPSWASILDNKLASKTYVDIILSGSREENVLNISAEITMDSDIPQGNLIVHFIVVEDVEYAGRNGIRDHKNVMRKMITGPDGEAISISSNQVIEKTITLDNDWIQENTGVLVFVQDIDSKMVYQSQFITYDDLVITSVGTNQDIPFTFGLLQNYPNPFNPTTTIRYEIPGVIDMRTGDVPRSTQYGHPAKSDARTGDDLNFTSSIKDGAGHHLSLLQMHVKLVVYDILGREIVTLVDKFQNPGFYEIEFNAGNLPAGVYLYRLSAGGFVKSKRMVLLK